MISYSGSVFEVDHGTPTALDVCVQLMRLPRWCGATKPFWPVGIHSLIVADLLAGAGADVELAGLTHDAGEAMGFGDIASPLKPTDIQRVEHVMRARWASERLGVDLCDQWASVLVREADMQARIAERRLLFGDSDVTLKPANRALELTRQYLPEDPAQLALCVLGEGSMYVQQFYKRLLEGANAVHVMRQAAPGAVSEPVAGQAPSRGNVVAFPASHGDWQAAAGPDLGGVEHDAPATAPC